ncbi:hypothetical protein [Saccharothrix hoggarensis]|uniref:Uncharacterized protein n=1 Tax=Saccharothrix hoggarensis TaxID=913853 RepID=A0ABW3QUB8_9PSEU
MALLSVGVLFSATGAWGVLGIVAGLVGLVLLVFGTRARQPNGPFTAVSVVVGIGLAMASLFGAGSLLMTVVGDRVDCELVERRQESHRTSAPTLHHEFDCAGRPVSFSGSADYVAEVGERVALVVDPSGTFAPVLSGSVSGTRNWVVGGAALVGLAHVVLAATRPPRAARPRSKAVVNRGDFL